MKVYTCNNFQGFYPVGSAAVVVARDVYHARQQLLHALKDHGLEQPERYLKEMEIIELPLKSTVRT